MRTFTLFKTIRRKYIPWFQHVSGTLRVRISCERGDCPCGLACGGPASVPSLTLWRLLSPFPQTVTVNASEGFDQRPAVRDLDRVSAVSGRCLLVCPSTAKTPSRRKTESPWLPPSQSDSFLPAFNLACSRASEKWSHTVDLLLGN